MDSHLQKYLTHIDLAWGLVLNNSQSIDWARNESVKALEEYVDSYIPTANNLSLNEFKDAIKEAYETGNKDYANFDYYATDSEDFFRKKYGLK